MTEIATRHVPIRTCMGCGRKAEKAALIRVVNAPGSTLRVDLHQRLPGRGAWLHPHKDCYARARKTGRLTRSIRLTNVTDQSWAQVEDFFTAQG